MTQDRHLPEMRRTVTIPSRFFGDHRELIGELGKSDEPIGTLIVCSEMGWAPDNLFHLLPGQLLIVQNLANCIPSRAVDSVTVGSIEFGFRNQQCRHLIVCGHLRCRPIQMAIREVAAAGASVDVVGSGVSIFATHDFRGTSEILKKFYRNSPQEDLLEIATQEHVLVQVENILTHASVSDRLLKGLLKIHAWIVDDATSRIFVFDPIENEFRIN